jgi:glutamyl-tRNA reductase
MEPSSLGAIGLHLVESPLNRLTNRIVWIIGASKGASLTADHFSLGGVQT